MTFFGSACAIDTNFEQATTTIDDAEFVQVWNLLDIVLICIERGQCDGLLIFYLAEELLDSQSIDGCRKVFDYLESRRERLVAVSERTAWDGFSTHK